MSLLDLPLGAARLGGEALRGGARLATLPARLTTRAVLAAAEQLLDVLERSSLVEKPDPAPRERPGPAPRERPAAAPRARSNGSTVEPVRPSAAPAHVDTEVELVAEFADAGAGDGAGASVTVEPPWPRYGRMKAAEVIDRLPVQREAALSMVLLYERSHRARRSVIEAAERELARRADPARR